MFSTVLFTRRSSLFKLASSEFLPKETESFIMMCFVAITNVLIFVYTVIPSVVIHSGETQYWLNL